MSKQKDLIKVFNFLAEYLTEESVETKPIVEPVTTKVAEDPTVLGVHKDEILDLMRKIDEIQKVRDTFDEPFMRKFLPEKERDSEEKAKIETKATE